MGSPIASLDHVFVLIADAPYIGCFLYSQQDLSTAAELTGAVVRTKITWCSPTAQPRQCLPEQWWEPRAHGILQQLVFFVCIAAPASSDTAATHKILSPTEAGAIEALKATRLLHYAHPLRNLGCVTVEDLREIREADLYYIKIPRVQKRCFQETFCIADGESILTGQQSVGRKSAAVQVGSVSEVVATQSDADDHSGIDATVQPLQDTAFRVEDFLEDVRGREYAVTGAGLAAEDAEWIPSDSESAEEEPRPKRAARAKGSKRKESKAKASARDPPFSVPLKRVAADNMIASMIRS